MNKDDLLKIINYAKDNKLSERKSAILLGYKNLDISHYKRKYGLEVRKSTNPITKEQLIEFLSYCKEHCISEEEGKERFGINTKGSLIYHKKKYGIPFGSTITKEKIEEILRYSLENQIPEKEACKKVLGETTPKGLHYYKHKFGIPVNPIGNAPFTAREKRTKNVDDNFFEKPNVLNSYYAGFFAADGNVAQDKKSCVISLALKDRDWLENFAKDIKFEGEVRNGVAKKKYPYSTIDFTSEKIAQDLKRNFSITPKKSLTLQPPKIFNKELIDAFICGYIDGDGCISLTKSKTQLGLTISVLGTLEMCCWIQKRFSEILNIENVGCIFHNKEHKDNTFSYTVADKRAREIFKHFYSLNVPKLKRKWSEEKYQHCLNYHKALPICRRKGVNVFNVKGEFLKHCDTLIEAQEYTKVCFTTISELCKQDDNKHQGNGFMFSRTKDEMKPYVKSKFLNKKYLDKNGNIKTI